LISGLKRTNVVSTTTDPETGEIIEIDPTKGINLPKVKADVGGARIRAMLASMNSEKD